jgi:hypothetical protein
MLRAITLSGQRSDEIARLRLGCIRWQHDTTATDDDRVTARDAVCLLDVPTHKTGTAFTKPVDSLLGRAIEAWQAMRPGVAGSTARPASGCTTCSPSAPAGLAKLRHQPRPDGLPSASCSGPKWLPELWKRRVDVVGRHGRRFAPLGPRHGVVAIEGDVCSVLDASLDRSCQIGHLVAGNQHRFDAGACYRAGQRRRQQEPGIYAAGFAGVGKSQEVELFSFGFFRAE